MSLAQYHKKRTFQKTPEPKGTVSQSKAGPLTFVIQKHHATRLHYDFRLELDGVLKSWAVPKGPSLNPEDKRLAMMVEDHPLDYAGFEGIIPKGNYGAGTVMVWDKGVYSPLTAVDRKEAEKILLAQLEKGHLTFVMLGEKLKGEFALIKTHGSEENAWLLVKKNDEYASEKDILEKDASVLTDRSLNEIAKQAIKKQEVWFSKPKDLDLGKAPQSPMPHHIKPMVAMTIEEPFDSYEWLFELKWDGYRAIAEIASGETKLYSRNHQSFKERYAPIAKELEKFPSEAVLDGEIVVVDKDGRPSFRLMQNYPSGKGELLYYVFDILYYDGRDLTNLPLLKRKEILRQMLPSLPHVRFSDYIEETGKAFFVHANKLGLEGVMAKKKDSVYQQGVRSSDWLKLKTTHRQEAVIAGFTEPKGSRDHFGALVLGIYRHNKLEYIGHTGSGFSDQGLASLYEKLTALEQAECPFETVPKTNAPATWVKPVLVCEVTFQEWTHDHMMRHPIFLGLRDDKSAPEVEPERVFAKDPPANGQTLIEAGEQKITIANPSKIFWPEESYTKEDLIEYYSKISDILLPYLKDRPESLLRYPDGITGEGFYQKNVSHLTAHWLRRIKIDSDSEDKTIEYLLCQDKATLLYIINLGCIDLHPWNSRTESLKNPDYVILDLDPEKASFQDVISVALATRDVLEKLDIVSYPKTSGSRGLHIYIPMEAKYTYDQARQFSELLGIQIQQKLPDLVSLKRNPYEREGKVYIDYLRNAKGQTAASVYSVRPKPHATVSTPLKWEEVTKALDPTKFTMKTMFNRLENHGDLFKGVLGKGIDIAKILAKLESQK